MLEVSAALEIVLRHAKRLPPAKPDTPAVGLVLAEDIPADRDSPPFDKSMMDGYAVCCGDATELVVIEEVPAGTVPTSPVGRGQATRIFTGAPIPAGAEAVVPVEKTVLAGDRVTLHVAPKPGEHILRRGTEMTAGQVVIPAGTVLTPAAIGLLAAVGRTDVTTYPIPWVAVLATGDELVDTAETPGSGEIRNSNGPMLVAQADRTGAAAYSLGIARDDRDDLAAKIGEGLSADVLVLAGGVSAGGLDLVPDVLTSMGMTTHFHQLRMKPGKPLLFGTIGDTLVFGLPGNPVSSLVGFELFVRPAIRKMAGHAEPGPVVEKWPLACPFTADNNRPTYHPAKVENGQVRPLPWFGSPDLRGVLTADALVVLPAGHVSYTAGTTMDVIRMGG